MAVDMVEQGVAAAQRGDLAQARTLLMEAVRAYPQSEIGWLWLGKCMAEPDRREFCFKRVLAINPQNAEAQRLLQTPAITAPSAPSPAPSRPAAPPAQLPITPKPTPPSLLSFVAPPPVAPELNQETPEPIVTEAPAPAAPKDVVKPAPVAAESFGITPLMAGGIGLLLAVLCGGLVLVYLAASGTFNRFQPTAVLPTAAATAIKQPTLPPAWTATPAPPATATAPTATRAPSRTPSLSFEQRWAAVQAQIAEARALRQAEDYAAAIVAWDAILAQVPEYADGYFRRAANYVALLQNQRILEEYLTYNQQALADLNQAIALDASVGEYFLWRYEVEANLAGVAYYRVEQDYWHNLALADARQAALLGSSDPFADRHVIFLLYALDRCEEGLTETQNLEASLGSFASEDYGLYTAYAEGYLCMGDLDKALENSNMALDLNPDLRRKQNHWTILYIAGEPEVALEMLDVDISDSAYYCGCRYYWRALIEAEQGETETALEDLAMGEMQTWTRGGLRLYTLAQLALAAGETEEGIALLQEADATFWYANGAPLRERIRAELAELNAPTIAPTLAVSPTPTKLPVTPQAQPPTVTPLPRIDFPEATPHPISEPLVLTLDPDEFSDVFHVYVDAETPVAFQDIAYWHATLGDFTQMEESPLFLYVWNVQDGEWYYYNLGWGENYLGDGDPEKFITLSGDFYIYLYNSSTEDFEIPSLTFQLGGDDATGFVTYGP